MDTIEDFIEQHCWETSLVGDKASSQDENTDPDECYWISVKDVKILLYLLKQQLKDDILYNKGSV